jgi:hypothetical protein
MNGYNKFIKIEEVKLFQPVGFQPVEQAYKAKGFSR